MKLVFFLPVITLASAFPFKRSVDPALVPEFGVQAGVNPSASGDCDGITNDQGVVVRIPCSCPPNRGVFLEVNGASGVEPFTYANHIFDIGRH